MATALQALSEVLKELSRWVWPLLLRLGNHLTIVPALLGRHQVFTLLKVMLWEVGLQGCLAWGPAVHWRLASNGAL